MHTLSRLTAAAALSMLCLSAAAQHTPADMDARMKQMQAAHEKMMAAKTPEARRALMAEHMKSMRDGMAMMDSMHGMHGKGMGGGPAAGHGPGHGAAPGAGPGPGMPPQMMEKRMDMMQQMMKMMMERMSMTEPARPGSGVNP